MKIFRTSITTGVLCLLCVGLLTANSASALTVTKAKVVGDKVIIKGFDAVPFATISWDVGFDDEEVGQADAKGRFKFS